MNFYEKFLRKQTNKQTKNLSPYETARHEPGTRTVPICPALYRFVPRNCKKLRFLAKKLIN